MNGFPLTSLNRTDTKKSKTAKKSDGGADMDRDHDSHEDSSSFPTTALESQTSILPDGTIARLSEHHARPDGGELHITVGGHHGHRQHQRGAEDASTATGATTSASEELTRVRRKVLWRLLPLLLAFFSLSLMDRSAIGLVVETGMYKQYGFGGNSRYILLLLSAFPANFCYQWMATKFTLKFGSLKWMPVAFLLWRTCFIATACVENLLVIMVLRTVGSLFEAILLPAMVLLMSNWLTAPELVFLSLDAYSFGLFFTGLNAALGYAFAQIQTSALLAGWRWIYLGQAIMSIVLGLPAYLLIVDSPFSHRCRFLDDFDRRVIAAHVERGRTDTTTTTTTDSPEATKVKALFAWAFKDAVFVGLTVCIVLASLGSYAFAFFGPRLMATLELGLRRELCLLMIPYVLAFPAGLMLVRLDLRTDGRLRLIAALAVLSGIGCATYYFPPMEQTGLRYVGVLLACLTMNVNGPQLVMVVQEHVKGGPRRAFAYTFLVEMAGVGGILAVVLFPDAAPRFTVGLATLIVTQCIIVVVASLMLRVVRRRGEGGVGA